MNVIYARGVDDAWHQAVRLIRKIGVRQESRAGPVLVAPTPVTTVYEEPRRRVLLDPVRDVNPFLSLFESLWLLAGRDDARWLDQFVADFSSRFAEDDGHLHGSYGKRWRDHFGYDQLEVAAEKLRNNPDDRQAVISMWDPTTRHEVVQDALGVGSTRDGRNPVAGADDLRGSFRDRPCNLQVLLRVRELPPPPTYLTGPGPHYSHELDVTVTCRSNDVVWGCYGSNMVQFSYLQEYLAAMIGVGVGRYYQVSNNWHMYDASAHLANEASALDWAERGTEPCLPLVGDPETFDDELRAFLAWTEGEARPEDLPRWWSNSFFPHTAAPMYLANRARRRGQREEARRLALMITDEVWRVATLAWLERRRKS